MNARESETVGDSLGEMSQDRRLTELETWKQEMVEWKKNVEKSMEEMTGQSKKSDLAGCEKGTIQPAKNFDPSKDANCLRKAFGDGDYKVADETAIIDILGNRCNDQRQRIKEAYNTMKTSSGKDQDFEDDIKEALGGSFEDLCLALLVPSDDYMAYCLNSAFNSEEDGWELALIEILCSVTTDENSPPNEVFKIKKIKESYKKMYGRELEEEVKDKTSGDLHFQSILLSQLACKRADAIDEGKIEDDAEELHQAGEGNSGTEESTFSKILASRSVEHLKQVFEVYKEKRDKDIDEVITSEITSPAARKAYLAIVKSVRSYYSFVAECLYLSMKDDDTEDDDLIRLIVSHSEVDLQEVKACFQDMYQMHLSHMVEGDTSGPYEDLLLRIVGP